jgi:peptidoglycan/xylan/chitin deacetylase (PgdA/CDA1 family)
VSWGRGLLVLVLGVITISAEAKVDRPPQFVMLAFDNCQENQTWQEVSSFLDEVNSIRPDAVHFTFFLSAVGLMSDKARMAYTDPMGRKGASNIGFGGSENDVLQRIAWINKMHKEGNEMASHAVGHFSGKNWSVDQWKHELQQYEHIINHVAEINDLKGSQVQQGQLSFTYQDMVGFRAPYLDGGPKLNEALAENQFLYDTSDTNQGWEPNTWPQKFKGVSTAKGLWNFGLSFITMPMTAIKESERLAGHSRSVRTIKVPAMDYNLCFQQTGGCPDKDVYANQADSDAEQVLHGYLTQFIANYNSNRAPIHIGHHFFPYHSGGYDRMLLRFAKAVCTLPEVRCATYKELATFMESAGPGARDAYQAGSFPSSENLKIEDVLKRAL